MTELFKQFVLRILNLNPTWICKWEFIRQKFERINERPMEYAFVFKVITKVCPETILDVGSGTTSLAHMMRSCGSVVTAMDNRRDYWRFGMVNRHYHVLDKNILSPDMNKRFDMISCVSVLEHIDPAADAIRNMFNLLKPGGHLVLTFPYTENQYVRNVYELPSASYGKDYPYVTQSFSRKELEKWLEDNNGIIVEQEYWNLWEGGCWTVGKQITPAEQVGQSESHQLTCVHIRKET